MILGDQCSVNLDNFSLKLIDLNSIIFTYMLTLRVCGEQSESDSTRLLGQAL